MPSQHKSPSLRVRLPDAVRTRLLERVARTGEAVNRVISEAVREKLDRETGWCASCHRTVYLDDPRHGTGCTQDHDPGCGCGQQPSNYGKEQ